MTAADRLKLAVLVAGLGVGAYVLWKASGAASKVAGAVSDAAWAVTPWNQENVIYGGVNTVGKALVNDPQGAGMNADGSWTFGGWLYDVTHPDVVAAVKAVTAPTGPTGGVSSGYSDAEAAAARARFAATDTRRVDKDSLFGLFNLDQ